MRRAVLQYDVQDFYTTTLKYVVAPLMAIYISISVYGVVVTAPGEHETNYSSPDTALLMTLKTPFYFPSLKIHGAAGVVLVILTFIQKHTVKNLLPPSTASVVQHRYIGYTIVVLMLVMVSAGFTMRHNSTFESFPTAMIFFAAPWFLFSAAVVVTAKKKLWLIHAIAGNLVVGGCIGVPLARVCGSILQRTAYEDDLEKGYYVGIGCSTVVIGALQLIEIPKRIRESMKRERKNGRPN